MSYIWNKLVCFSINVSGKVILCDFPSGQKKLLTNFKLINCVNFFETHDFGVLF